MASNRKGVRVVFIQNKPPVEDDITAFIQRWNGTYPIDRWWREKHQVAFNSPAHRVVSFLDMYIEWKESRIYDRTLTNYLKNSEYKPGDWLREQTTKGIEEDIREFESMDLTKLDDKQ